MSRYTDKPSLPAPHCFTHAITIETAMALAEDAEKAGDEPAARKWYAMAEELDRVEAEKKRRERQRERELLLQHGRRYGF